MLYLLVICHGPWVRTCKNLVCNVATVSNCNCSASVSLFLPSNNGKSLHNPPNYLGWNTSPLNYKTGYSTPWTFKTGQITPSSGFRGCFCFFSFLFISAEFLKNHNKSQKNHKIKHSILLDSWWVDLHSKYIIWYTLVQSFFCSFKSIFSVIN